ncbi:MAG: Glyoxalase/bleomycin resistance [Planctomycetota bacterium]|nr:MAG: Glyoxalase/bleomycin resistance [Planctomycetota bacterium]
MKVPEVALVVVRTHRLEDVCDFYRALGFDFQEEQHGKGPVHFSAAAGPAVLEIYPLPEGASVDASLRLGFFVDDVTAAVDSVRQNGGRVDTKPNSGPWGLRAVVRDPDGRAVELFQR